MDRMQHELLRPRSPMSSLSPTSSHSKPPSPYDLFVQQQNMMVHQQKQQSQSQSQSPNALAALHKRQHDELVAYQQRELAILQQLAYHQQQSQVYAAQLTGDANNNKAGIKRTSEEDDFERFLSDMKKRKVEPVYDDGESHSLPTPDLTVGRFATSPAWAWHSNVLAKHLADYNVQTWFIDSTTWSHQLQMATQPSTACRRRCP